MQSRVVKLLGLQATVVAALAFPAAASAARLTGVVVHHNARAHSFVIAGHGGTLSAIHATRAPALGRHVSVDARRLRNGTWAAERVRVGRVTTHVRIHGTVTHVDRSRGLFVVSARGVSLLVRDRVGKLHRARLASDSQPTVGEVVTVGGDLAANAVDASTVQSQGQDGNGLDLEGTVKAIDTTSRTLTVSADDSEQSGAMVTVDVPASFDLTLFSVGEEVELIASLNPDGTYTLEQSSNDGSARQAGNPGDSQGDGEGDHRPSAEQQCAAQQNDPSFASTHNGLSFIAFWETDPNQPNDAFGRCVDGMAHGTASTSSPELQCHIEHSDPNFPASHNGESFAQFYNPQDPTNLGDAYGRCVDSKSSGDGSGGSGDGAGTGATGPTGPTGPSLD